MNGGKKIALLHKIHAWASLTFNWFFCLFSNLINRADTSFWVEILIYLGLTIGYVLLRISYDMHINDTSASSLIFTYVCVLALSILIVYEEFKNASELMALILIIAVVMEISVAFSINHYYVIMRKLRALFKRKK